LLILGSARLQRAGFGILPKQSLKSSRTQDAFASTPEACAPQIVQKIVVERFFHAPHRCAAMFGETIERA
jgi:hypothetical protein